MRKTPSTKVADELRRKNNCLLFLFLAMERMKNKNYVLLWVRILTLSDNTRGSSSVPVENHAYVGINVSMSGIMDWIKLAYPKLLEERFELLKNELYITVCYNNN